MKKLIGLLCFVVAFTAVCLVITSKSGVCLYLLNWGEYIDEDLLVKFEEENNVTVVMEEVGSSEQMYSKISMGVTAYDVAIPGDYIIEKLSKENKLHSIDKTKMNNYNSILNDSKYETVFNPDLENILNTLDYKEYTMPYFWGVYACLYSTKKDFVEDIVIENGFNSFFDRTLYPSPIRIGMYSVARWDVTCYLLANNIDVNTNDFKLDNLGNNITHAIKQASFDLWGDDILKKDIANGNLDLAFVQLGDFFDQYYAQDADGLEVEFNAHIPDYTAAFFDGMIIPKTTRNYDLALKFVDFMLNPENALANAEYVGYCPTLTPVIKAYEEQALEDPDTAAFLNDYPFYLNPLAGKTATLFKDLGSSYQTEVESIVNKAKS